VLKEQYLLERREKMGKNHSSRFLWSKEKRLMYWLIGQQNKVFIWDNSEKEKFKKEFF